MIETTLQRATRTLARYGKSPLVLRGMNESELSRLAALEDVQGDIRERVRTILVDHYEAKKATDEESDTLSISE